MSLCGGLDIEYSSNTPDGKYDCSDTNDAQDDRICGHDIAHPKGEADARTVCPALTVNEYGKGKAYYITSNNDTRFLSDFYGSLEAKIGFVRSLDVDLPHGVSAQLRTDGEKKFVFLMNFNAAPTTVDFGKQTWTDLLTDEQVSGRVELDTYQVMVLVG